MTSLDRYRRCEHAAGINQPIELVIVKPDGTLVIYRDGQEIIRKPLTRGEAKSIIVSLMEYVLGSSE